MLTDELYTSQTYAASYEAGSQSTNSKVCPRCGAILFKDMQVCYGCLYDFDTTQNKSFLATSGQIGTQDHTFEKNKAIQTGDRAKQEIVEKSIDCSLSESADDTIDLSEAHRVGNTEVRVISAAMEVRCGVPDEGITIGRENDNDVILHDRTVSRHHLRIIPDKSGIMALNQGATNPASYKGVPILDSMHVASGDSIDICGIQLKVIIK